MLACLEYDDEEDDEDEMRWSFQAARAAAAAIFIASFTHKNTHTLMSILKSRMQQIVSVM